MNSIFHALDTVTLAAWLSVAGFGTVGILMPEPSNAPVTKPAEEMVTTFENPEIQLDDGILANSPNITAPEVITEPNPVPEILPNPPEMPELPEQKPLPEIPDMAPPPEQTPRPPLPDPSPREPKSNPEPSATTHRSTQIPERSNHSTGNSTTSGSALSDSARLAAGRMPAPAYPAASRRAGQTGTVTVAFTVDASGRVISAYAATPSPWPLLNEEAVRTVRRWKFPPGGVMKLQRPIIFQLR